MTIGPACRELLCDPALPAGISQGRAREPLSARIIVILSAILFVTLLFGSPANAREENYNPTAVKNAAQTGVENANCNSALKLDCTEPGLTERPVEDLLFGDASTRAAPAAETRFAPSFNAGATEFSIEDLMSEPAITQGSTSRDGSFSVTREWELGAGGFPGGDTGLANTVSYMSERTNAVFSSPSPGLGNNLWVMVLLGALFYSLRRKKHQA